MPGSSCGMGLAGEDELHRALGVVDHGGQALDVGEDQVGALVGGEAAGEADGERVGREGFARSAAEISGGSPRRSACSHGAAADEVEQAAP